MIHTKPLCEASEKGKIVINKCLDAGYEIGTAKADKLLILMHGTMLSKYENPLFRQNVVAGKCGPIITEVERELMQVELQQTDAQFKFKEKMNEYICLLNREKQVMDEIIKEYGNSDLFVIMQDKRLRVLSELCYKDDNLNVIPNKLIEKVFDYYQFYDFDVVKQNECEFIKRIKKGNN